MQSLFKNLKKTKKISTWVEDYFVESVMAM